MQSLMVQFKTKVNEKDYSFHCPTNCTWQECCEAISAFKAYAVGKMQEQKENEEAKQNQPSVDQPMQEEVK